MGPVGSGQLTKLFNNALTITNMKNAEDVLALAAQVGLDLPALIEVIGASSGGSAALHALGTDITPSLAEHLHPLMRKDMHTSRTPYANAAHVPTKSWHAARPARLDWSKPPACSLGKSIKGRFCRQIVLAVSTSSTRNTGGRRLVQGRFVRR
ncbi:NAD-binding protein [Streptomyces sp. NPDC006527]|uniref:NAD-binding protein n=1 Tax=Streptomyces sp. NPDC006527 TaxID=3364749 RepID=UPI0036BC084D